MHFTKSDVSRQMMKDTKHGMDVGLSLIIINSMCIF